MTAAGPDTPRPADSEDHAPTGSGGHAPAGAGGRVPAGTEGRPPVDAEARLPAGPDGPVPGGPVPGGSQDRAPAGAEGRVPADPEGRVPAGSADRAPAGAAERVPADPEDHVSGGAEGRVPAVGRTWPVGTRPRVLRGWEPPATPYGPGHRGVDLAAPPGAPVRAVAAGRVSFAGRVAGRGVVSVELPGTGDPPLRTTYEPVRASVEKGDAVLAGQVIGAVEPTGSHCAAPCVHWGLRTGRTYLDPLSLLPPWLLNASRPRLLPVLGVPPGS
ncbi:murein hydrolase activator EnvC family protein [Streptomyces sp. NPDC085946]|uniref:murein hydrolase activator EnvC family protein n=1 Tax=Streptomyces sp. NPDC085946 TaxID=3365744 RepID=UPI0037CDFAED